MGKNPNAKRLKEKKHKEKTFEDIDDKEQKALELGCEIWELEDKLRELRQAEKDAENESEGEEAEEEQKEQKVVDFDAKFGKPA